MMTGRLLRCCRRTTVSSLRRSRRNGTRNRCLRTAGSPAASHRRGAGAQSKLIHRHPFNRTSDSRVNRRRLRQSISTHAKHCLGSNNPTTSERRNGRLKLSNPPPTRVGPRHTRTNNMKTGSKFRLVAAALLLASVGTANAAGCLKGAVVGGVAGHYAGHHAVVGAVGGCVVGHHLAKKHAEEQAAQRQAAPARVQ